MTVSELSHKPFLRHGSSFVLCCLLALDLKYIFFDDDSSLSHMIGALEISVIVYYYIKSTALCGKSPEPGQRNVEFCCCLCFLKLPFVLTTLCQYKDRLVRTVVQILRNNTNLCFCVAFVPHQFLQVSECSGFGDLLNKINSNGM